MCRCGPLLARRTCSTLTRSCGASSWARRLRSCWLLRRTLWPTGGYRAWGYRACPFTSRPKGLQEVKRERPETRPEWWRSEYRTMPLCRFTTTRRRRLGLGIQLVKTVYIYFKFILSISTTNISYCLGSTSILDIVAIIIQILLPDLSHVDIHKVSAPSVLRLLRKW